MCGFVQPTRRTRDNWCTLNLINATYLVSTDPQLRDIRCKNVFQRDNSCLYRQCIVHVSARTAETHAVRENVRRRLQLLELEVGSCAIWFRQILPFEGTRESPRVTRVHLRKVAHLACVAASQIKECYTIQIAFTLQFKFHKKHMNFQIIKKTSSNFWTSARGNLRYSTFQKFQTLSYSNALEYYDTCRKSLSL